MGVTGLESVVFGVEDFEACVRFWSDFGLGQQTAGADTTDGDAAVFRTAEGASVIVRHIGDPSLPPAPVEGSTAREIIWGVDTHEALAALGGRLGAEREVRQDDDGTLHATDPCGYAIGFRLRTTKPVEHEPTHYNAPNRPARIDRAATLYDSAVPQHLAHVVLLAPELDTMATFYEEMLGFRLTDRYPGNGHFYRAPGSADHHNLFLLRRGDAIGFHHVAFDVRDIHEVFGGGLHMTKRGWETHLGPGRHPISSAYFWYFRNPCGGAAEYDFDTDVVTDAWRPRDFEPGPEAFAEWALEDGIERYQGMQTTKT